MTSKFRNRQTYLEAFPQFASGLIGTEYSPLGRLSAPTGNAPIKPPQPQSVQQIKEKFGEVPSKKTLMRPPLQPTAKPQPLSEKYDPTLYNPIPKSQLDIPLYVALKMTYPNQINKYQPKAKQYGYDLQELTDQEHLVLRNPSKRVTIFGVRGTDLESTRDVLTDISLPFSSLIGRDIKSYDRYKKAEKKYEEVKKAYPNDEIIRVGHSLGGTIQSVMSKPNEKTYTYNRLYGPYDVKPNEIAISVETDPLFIRKSEDKKKIITIPRTYYEKAKDYIALKKAKVNPLYEEKPIAIPEEYKTDNPNVLYKNIMQEIPPLLTAAYNMRLANAPITMRNIIGYSGPIALSEAYIGGNILLKEAANSHALENLPLNIRVEPSTVKKIQRKK